MKEENKKRWMVWAIVALAIMNISTLMTILYHNYQSKDEGFVTPQGQVQSENTSVKYSGRYFRDQLDLSNEQMSRFVTFNPSFRQQAISINLHLENIRNQMLLELASKNTDVNKLYSLSDSIGNLHTDLKKLTFKYYLDIKNICNQHQQKKLEQLFSEMFVGDIQIGHNMNGGPNRGRYGRRSSNQ
jgi:hypothetical protein